MKYASFVFIFLALVACKKDPPTPTPSPSHLGNGFLVLNEGLFQHNNSTLLWQSFDGSAPVLDFFEQQAGRSLGDTGNDLKRYGNKIYVVVNVSSTIEILDASTGKSIKQILMLNGNTPKQPRYIAFSGNKAFVSCYDGYVDVLDTASLNILQRIPVGANPEQLTISNNKLYVSNSGGLNAPNVDSTVSVISLNSLTELSRITVGKNPGKILTGADGKVYVISRGDYLMIPSQLHRIDPVTDTKESSYSFAVQDIIAYNNQLLVIRTSNGVKGYLFDLTAQTCESSPHITFDGTTTYYGAQFRTSNQSWYVCDANGYTLDGFVRRYSSSGNLIHSYAVGLNPNNILFYE